MKDFVLVQSVWYENVIFQISIHTFPSTTLSETFALYIITKYGLLYTSSRLYRNSSPLEKS